MNDWQHHLELAYYEAQYRQKRAEAQRLARQVDQGGLMRTGAHVLLRIANMLQRYSERMIHKAAPRIDTADTPRVTAHLLH